VNATWSRNGVTVAGGRGIGAELNQLAYPRGAFVDDTGAIYITDDNLRVVKWERGASSGVMVAGFGGRGSNNDQFQFYLHNLAVNKEGTMFICDKGNERVMRWMKNAKSGEVILSNLNCYGVTLDGEGSLYVSNLDQDLILKYCANSSGSEIVAGGNGRGAALNQFNRPHFPFVDHNFNIFVPDTSNHRVMKWPIGSKEGIIVSEDNGLDQLRGPHAVVVDELGTIYVVDHDLHQVIRWFKGAKSGELLFGGHGYGDRANQFAFPIDIDFDREGNLYITDRNNHRIQMYAINKSSCD
jgi:sugar lactone lactonase YvrE